MSERIDGSTGGKQPWEEKVEREGVLTGCMAPQPRAAEIESHVKHGSLRSRQADAARIRSGERRTLSATRRTLETAPPLKTVIA